MERKPSQAERSAAEIQEELDGIGQEIIKLNREVRTTHEEYGGNSPEDNAQEAQQDMTTQAILATKIDGLRRREAALREELARVTKGKAA